MELIEDIDDPYLPIAQACSALTVSRATLYRQTSPPVAPSGMRRAANPRRPSEHE